jgi:hypothetical protein
MNPVEIVEIITGHLKWLKSEVWPTEKTQTALTRAIELLQEPDEPTRLPFRNPVPNGMEVVTRDGRKVEQLTEFKGLIDPYSNYPYIGVVNGMAMMWNLNGMEKDAEPSSLDLFLRPIERKVWVVEYEWHEGLLTMGHFNFLEDAKDSIEKDKEHLKSATIYEATLKPVK